MVRVFALFVLALAACYQAHDASPPDDPDPIDDSDPVDEPAPVEDPDPFVDFGDEWNACLPAESCPGSDCWELPAGTTRETLESEVCRLCTGDPFNYAWHPCAADITARCGDAAIVGRCDELGWNG